MTMAQDRTALDELEALLGQMQEEIARGLRLLGEHRGEEEDGDGSASP